jgi:hypothetical protein
VKAAPAIGLAIVAAHAALLPWALDHCRRDELSVRLDAPLAAETVQLDGIVPASLRDQVVIDDTVGPGLHRRRWSITYRGGFTRRVGAAQLVGPFQDPAAPPCSGHVIVGQRLLDGGPAGRAGTVAAIVERELTANLEGQSQFPIGSFQKLRTIELTWNRPEDTPADKGLVSEAIAPNGYVRAHVVVAFKRVDIPVTVALIPVLVDGALEFKIRARAQLDFDNRVIQWASDLVGGDRFATDIAQDQIDQLLVTVLEPPPPVELPNGSKLVFTYCGAQPSIVHHAYAALPIAVQITRVAGAPEILPPRLGPMSAPPPPRDVKLALDLDLDALNALLYELWRTRYLDTQLDAAGLAEKFNTDPTVTSLLSLRISPLRLALPPVLTAVGDHLHMAGDLAVTIDDGPTRTKGRVWSALEFRFAPAGSDGIVAAVDLGELELSCEPTPGLLKPCYGDLVDALRARAPDVHDTLTSTFTAILGDIFVGQRISDPSLPAELAVTGVTATSIVDGKNARLRLLLAAAIEPR